MPLDDPEGPGDDPGGPEEDVELVNSIIRWTRLDPRFKGKSDELVNWSLLHAAIALMLWPKRKWRKRRATETEIQQWVTGFEMIVRRMNERMEVEK